MTKELKRGVYRVFDAADGRSFVGYSLNLEGTLKRLRFELALNACSYRPLQEFYNIAKDAQLETVEEYSPLPGMSEEETEAHVRALAFVWKSKLDGAQLIQTPIVY